MKIVICDRCRKKCDYHYREILDDWGYRNVPYSDCCSSEVTFYDSIKEVILANLEDDR